MNWTAWMSCQISSICNAPTLKEYRRCVAWRQGIFYSEFASRITKGFVGMFSIIPLFVLEDLNLGSEVWPDSGPSYGV
jgi:hypothetical protein